ncbi:MAG: damage-inducible protein DinB [Chitinophagaceae bacterium]|nr:MAG: damage-inducible protein DinB [Chitinophagaceae bacterium]
MADIKLGEEYAKELDAEFTSTRKCLERIPETLFQWKPHPKSMELGYLTILVAEIPKWITVSLQEGEIDFATFSHGSPKTTADVVKYFDDNVAAAKKALNNASNEDFNATFSLKNSGHLLYSSTMKDNVSSCVNHMVHHRGQLTVYMRLNEIAVPSIYGPSADDKTF